MAEAGNIEAPESSSTAPTSVRKRGKFWPMWFKIGVFLRHGNKNNLKIAEREVLKCLIYLALEQQVAMQMTFFYRAVTLSNSLSNDLKLCKSVNVSKRRLRSRLLSNFSISAS